CPTLPRRSVRNRARLSLEPSAGSSPAPEIAAQRPRRDCAFRRSDLAPCYLAVLVPYQDDEPRPRTVHWHTALGASRENSSNRAMRAASSCGGGARRTACWAPGSYRLSSG